MALIANFLANARGIDQTDDITALDRGIVKELTAAINRGDTEIPATLVAIDEIQTLSAYTVAHDGGDFTLTITLRNGETFTTAALGFGALEGAIETEIDIAATSAGVTDWTNGDITVTGGPLTADDFVLTYDGASVAGNNHTLVVLNDSLTGGTTAIPPAVTTTNGQTIRRAWGVLVVMGVIDASEIPAQGVDPGILTLATNPGDNSYYPSAATIRALAEEVGIEDLSIPARESVLAATGLS